MSARPLPSPEHADLETVLVSAAAIRRRLKRLGAEISRVYGTEEITVISVINGAILFTADLLREIPNPVRLDCIRVSSYRNATRSALLFGLDRWTVMAAHRVTARYLGNFSPLRTGSQTTEPRVIIATMAPAMTSCGSLSALATVAR